ncbi:MAG: hypothetical protein L0Z53_24645 [Acidobacteriales bacterium]|nr:hypothetical protein [Terriglobales bacterium]
MKLRFVCFAIVAALTALVPRAECSSKRKISISTRSTKNSSHYHDSRNNPNTTPQVPNGSGVLLVMWP